MTPNDHTLHLLFLSMEADVIRRLIAGNDTQCFTTQQFGEAVDRWIAEISGATREELELTEPPIETRRAQLIEVAPLVYEVAPDVWTPTAAWWQKWDSRTPSPRR